jgi:hypothetical protein
MKHATKMMMHKMAREQNGNWKRIEEFNYGSSDELRDKNDAAEDGL